MKERCLNSSDHHLRVSPIDLPLDELQVLFDARVLQFNHGHITCHVQDDFLKIGSGCRFYITDADSFVFVDWWMFDHHLRIVGGSFKDLTPRQIEFIEKVLNLAESSTITTPKTKREEKVRNAQSRVEIAIEQAKPKLYNPLFPKDEKTAVPKEPDIPAVPKPDPQMPSFF